MIEILIVGVAVPMALYLSKKRSAAKTTCSTAAAEKKSAPWRQASVARTTSQVQESKQKNVSPAQADKCKQKTRLDSLLKEGNLKDAQVVLTELINQSSADAVSYNMVISACAKNGDISDSL